MARTFRTNFAFNATGLNSLLRARNIVSSLGGTSWGAFNQAARGASMASREFAKLAGAMGGGIGFGLLAKSMITANAELQTNRLLFQQMVGDAGEADKMISTLQENAAQYGYDLGEVFKSARGLYSGFSGGGRIVTDDDLNRLMKLTQVANLMDTENRGLSFAAFSIKEMAQGIGAGDYKSIKSRLEIGIGKEMAASITNSLQKAMSDKSSVKDAITLIENAFKEAKLDPKMLDFMADNGFYQNLNAIKSYAERVFLAIGKPVTDELGKSLNRFKKQLQPYFRPDSAFVAMLEAFGSNMLKNVEKIFGPIAKGIKEWYFSTAGGTFLDTIQDSFALIGQIGEESLKVFGAFFHGLGIHTNAFQEDFRKFAITVLNEVKEMVPHLTPFAFALGRIVRTIADLVVKNPELAATLVTFKMFGAGQLISGILGLAGALRGLGIAAGVAGAAGGAGAAAGGVGGLAGLLIRLASPVGGGTMLATLKTQIFGVRLALTSIGVTIAGAGWLMSGFWVTAAAGVGYGIGLMIRELLTWSGHIDTVDNKIKGLIDSAMRLANIAPQLDDSGKTKAGFSVRSAEAMGRFANNKATKEDLAIIDQIKKSHKGVKKDDLINQLSNMGEFKNVLGMPNYSALGIAKNSTELQLLSRIAELQHKTAYQNAFYGRTQPNINYGQQAGPPSPTAYDTAYNKQAAENARVEAARKTGQQRLIKAEQKISFGNIINNFYGVENKDGKTLGNEVAEAIKKSRELAHIGTPGNHLDM